MERIEAKMRLEGGHPSMYPTASLGANLMIGLALILLRGRTEMPRGLEMSDLGFDLEGLDIPHRPDCPSCSQGRRVMAASSQAPTTTPTA